MGGDPVEVLADPAVFQGLFQMLIQLERYHCLFQLGKVAVSKKVTVKPDAFDPAFLGLEEDGDPR